MSLIEWPTFDCKRTCSSSQNFGSSKCIIPKYWSPSYSIVKNRYESKFSGFDASCKVPTSPVGHRAAGWTPAVHRGGQTLTPSLRVICGWSRSFTSYSLRQYDLSFEQRPCLHFEALWSQPESFCQSVVSESFTVCSNKTTPRPPPCQICRANSRQSFPGTWVQPEHGTSSFDT